MDTTSFNQYPSDDPSSRFSFSTFASSNMSGNQSHYVAAAAGPSSQPPSPPVSSVPEEVPSSVLDRSYGSLAEMCAAGDLEAVLHALNNGANVGEFDPQRGLNALAGAIVAWDWQGFPYSLHEPPQVQTSHLLITSHLLNSPSLTLRALNAPLPGPLTGGATPLILASYLGREDLIRILLGEGDNEVARSWKGQGWCNVDSRDGMGGTALMYAARDGKLSVSQILLSHDATPDLPDVNGDSAIQYASNAADGGYPDLVWMFEMKLRSTRVALCQQFTTRAPTERHEPNPPMPRPSLPNITRILNLPTNLFPSILSTSYLSPPPLSAFMPKAQKPTRKLLLHAIKHSNVDMLRALLFPTAPGGKNSDGIVNVNSKDKDGLTLMHHAMRVRVPNKDIIGLLWLSGSDTRFQDTWGSTPLHQIAFLAGTDPKKPPRTSSSSSNVQYTHDTRPTPRRSVLFTVSEEDSSVGGDLEEPPSSPKLSESQLPSPQQPAPSPQYAPNPVIARNLKGTPGLLLPPPTMALPPLPTLDGQEAGGPGYRFPDSEIEKQLREVMEFYIYALKGDPDLKDTERETPLHFAAEHGCSKEVLKVLLEHDVNLEDAFARNNPRNSLGVPIERIPTRQSFNNRHKTPRDLCKEEYIKFFIEADHVAAQRAQLRKSAAERLSKLLHAGGSGGVRPPIPPRSSSSSTNSSTMSTGSSTQRGENLERKAWRESVIRPLSPLSDHRQVEETFRQMVFNLNHVDETLTTGYVSIVKDDLAQQNSAHPAWSERDRWLDVASDDGRSESIKRLRYSFSSSRASNNTRPAQPRRSISSSATHSSWWSEPSEMYTAEQIKRFQNDLDSIFRLITHTSQMATSIFDFYSLLQTKIEDEVRAISEWLDLGNSDVIGVRNRVLQLQSREASLESILEEIAMTKADRALDGEFNQKIMAVVNGLSSSVSNIRLDNQTQGRLKVIDLCKASDQASKALTVIRQDAEAEDRSNSVVQAADQAIAYVTKEKSSLVANIIAPSSSNNSLKSSASSSSTNQKRDYPERSRPITRSGSFASSDTSDQPSVETPKSLPVSFYQQRPSVAASTSTNGSGETLRTMPSSASLPTFKLSQQPFNNENPPTFSMPWDSWPRKKEEDPEYIAAIANLDEIERDMAVAEEKVTKNIDHEQRLQSFMDGRLSDGAAKLSSKDRLEASRLMTVILESRIELEEHIQKLKNQQSTYLAILDRHEAEELARDNETRLKAYLRKQLSERRGKVETEYQYELAQCEEDSITRVAASSNGEEEDENGSLESPHLTYPDLVEECGQILRELQHLKVRLTGAPELCDRAVDDFDIMFRNYLPQIRKSCTTAAKYISRSKGALSRILQERMDEIVVLWEYVSVINEDSDDAVSIASSSFALDARFQLSLPTILTESLSSPKPRMLSPQSAIASTTGSSISGSHSVSMSLGSVSSNSSGTETAELHRLKQALTVKASQALKKASEDTREVFEWLGVVQLAADNLSQRLA